MEDGIFLTVKDLKRLLGCKDYETARKVHQGVRDSLKRKSKYVTVKEYCESEDLDFDYVWNYLRASPKKNRV